MSIRTSRSLRGGVVALLFAVNSMQAAAAHNAAYCQSMTGTSVSNAACIATAAYTLTLTPSTFQLVGFDTAVNIPMTLTRVSGNECVVGTWTAGADGYEAYIWAAAFPLASTIPASGAPPLALLAALLGMAGAFLLRRRKEGQA